MSLTDAQAKLKWCPQALAGKVVWEKCQTDACMAWRGRLEWRSDDGSWRTGDDGGTADETRAVGYCGLAGRPE